MLKKAAFFIAFALVLLTGGQARASVSFYGDVEEFGIPATLDMDRCDSDSGILELDDDGSEIEVHVVSVKDEGKNGVSFRLEADSDLPRRFRGVREFEFVISGREAADYRELVDEHERELAAQSEL